MVSEVLPCRIALAQRAKTGKNLLRSVKPQLYVRGHAKEKPESAYRLVKCASKAGGQARGITGPKPGQATAD